MLFAFTGPLNLFWFIRKSSLYYADVMMKSIRWDECEVWLCEMSRHPFPTGLFLRIIQNCTWRAKRPWTSHEVRKEWGLRRGLATFSRAAGGSTLSTLFSFYNICLIVCILGYLKANRGEANVAFHVHDHDLMSSETGLTLWELIKWIDSFISLAYYRLILYIIEATDSI